MICRLKEFALRHEIAVSLTLAVLLSGCATQGRLDTGAAGPALPPGAAMTLIGTSQTADPLIRQAQDAVTAALARGGHAMTADAPARIEIGLASRPAATGVAVIDGPNLSPSKRRKFLQSCRDRAYRLTLTHYGTGDSVPVTRAWAEKHDCRGTIEDSIQSLADKAVAALVVGTPSETSKSRATR